MGFPDPTWEPALVLKDDVPKLVLDYLKPLELQSAMAVDIISAIEAEAGADKELRRQTALRARERKRSSKWGHTKKRNGSRVATSAAAKHKGGKVAPLWLRTGGFWSSLKRTPRRPAARAFNGMSVTRVHARWLSSGSLVALPLIYATTRRRASWRSRAGAKRELQQHAGAVRYNLAV